MKTKQIKAHTELIWTPVPGGLKALLKHYILPADADSYERMVEQMAKALVRESAIQSDESQSYANFCARQLWRNGIPDARAALRAIGITAPKKGNK